MEITDRHKLQGYLAAAVAAQSEHPVYPRLVIEMTDGNDVSRVRLQMPGAAGEGPRWVEMPAGQAMTLIEGRARSIALEESDPFHYGHEAPFWAEVDWAVAELRCRPGNENAVLEVLIQGGNRAAKTEYAGKRWVEAMALNDGWLLWAFHADQAASRSVQQRRVWRYLPPDCKPASGKAKKTLHTKMNYNQESGFTENIFSLANGSAAHFKFYSGDVKALEGDEPDMVWSDEEIPEDWVGAIQIRLNTKAGKTRTIVAELREALAQKAAGTLTTLPQALRARMWRGVHLITFTPISGQTPTVRRFTANAVPLRTVPAEMLPVRGPDGKVCGYEHVPRLIRCKDSTRLGAYFHTSDNAHGGNYPGMKKAAEGKSREWVMIRLYGVTQGTKGAVFPKFTRQLHVVPRGSVPKDCTWYHSVDPCPGRNWFMLWAAVNPLGEVLIAREWPCPTDYIPGVGPLGEWATLASGKKMDGDRGPAQTALGWGLARYAEEIERVEKELYTAQHGADATGRIDVAERIIDSRAGNAPTLAQSETLTLIQSLSDLGLDFLPAGMRVTAEGERSNPIDEGVSFINEWLDYREDKVTTATDGRLTCAPGTGPKLFISEACENLIFAMENWTGADGQKGACKDPIDALRYLRISDPLYLGGQTLASTGGGCY